MKYVPILRSWHLFEGPVFDLWPVPESAVAKEVEYDSAEIRRIAKAQQDAFMKPGIDRQLGGLGAKAHCQCCQHRYFSSGSAW